MWSLFRVVVGLHFYELNVDCLVVVALPSGGRYTKYYLFVCRLLKYIRTGQWSLCSLYQVGVLNAVSFYP